MFKIRSYIFIVLITNSTKYEIFKDLCCGSKHFQFEKLSNSKTNSGVNNQNVIDAVTIQKHSVLSGIYLIQVNTADKQYTTKLSVH